MKKKIKLSLDVLRVDSFVTSLHEDESANLKGGTELTCAPACNTQAANCLTRPQDCQVSGQFHCLTRNLQECVESHTPGCQPTRPPNYC